MQLMQAGRVPSVTDVAEAAEVSRATAYRYFPTQAALVQAAVDEALGPILSWRSDSAGRRGADRGAARLRLPADRRVRGDAAGGAAAGDGPVEPAAGRDARATRRRSCAATASAVLGNALAPLRGQMAAEDFDRLRQSLSLVFGTEAFVVLKDIWGLDGGQARDVALWSAHALVRAAVAEAAETAREGLAAGRQRLANG